MRTTVFFGLVLFLVILVAASESHAQFGGIYGGGASPYNPKPTVSPYLNLLQGGGGSRNLPQYQTLVRPFLDQQATNERNSFETQMLGRQVNSLQNRVNSGGQVGAGRATGHPTRYMNYSHYYSLSR